MNLFVTICRRWQATLGGRAAERGSATIFVVGFAIVLFAGAGLAIDGGRAINARDKATDVAEQAARSGADQLDDVALRKQDGTVVLDPGRARAVAERFVSDAGYEHKVDVINNSVSVIAYKTYSTTILGIVGINSMEVSGNATASPATGDNGATP